MRRNILVLLLVLLGFTLGIVIVFSSRRLAEFYFSQMGFSNE